MNTWELIEGRRYGLIRSYFSGKFLVEVNQPDISKGWQILLWSCEKRRHERKATGLANKELACQIAENFVEMAVKMYLENKA